MEELFRLKEYEPLWGEWYVDSLLSEGNLANVYQVRNDKEEAVIKVIAVPKVQSDVRSGELGIVGTQEIMSGFFSDVVTEFDKELSRTGMLNSVPGVLPYKKYEAFQRSEDIGYDFILLMDKETNLNDYVAKKDDVTNKEIVDIIKAVGVILFQAHEEKIVHKDIKPENIFIDRNGKVRVSDFAIRRKMESYQAGNREKRNTVYSAPEILSEYDYSVNTDIYALGMVLYVLLNDGEVPPGFANRNFKTPVPKPVRATDSLFATVEKAIAYRAKERFSSMEEMLEALEQLTEEDCKLPEAYVTIQQRKKEEKRRREEEKRQAEERKREEARRQEEERKRKEEQRQEEERQREEARRQEEEKRQEEARRQEEERQREERMQEEERQREAERQLAKERRKEDARREEKERQREEARQAEEARLREAAKQAEEEIRRAEEERQREEARRAEEARQKEEDRLKAEAERQLAERKLKERIRQEAEKERWRAIERNAAKQREELGAMAPKGETSIYDVGTLDYAAAELTCSLDEMENQMKESREKAGNWHQGIEGEILYDRDAEPVKIFTDYSSGEEKERLDEVFQNVVDMKERQEIPSGWQLEKQEEPEMEHQETASEPKEPEIKLDKTTLELEKTEMEQQGIETESEAQTDEKLTICSHETEYSGFFDFSEQSEQTYQDRNQKQECLYDASMEEEPYEQDLIEVPKSKNGKKWMVAAVVVVLLIAMGVIGWSNQEVRQYIQSVCQSIQF